MKKRPGSDKRKSGKSFSRPDERAGGGGRAGRVKPRGAKGGGRGGDRDGAKSGGSKPPWIQERGRDREDDRSERGARSAGPRQTGPRRGGKPGAPARAGRRDFAESPPRSRITRAERSYESRDFEAPNFDAPEREARGWARAGRPVRSRDEGRAPGRRPRETSAAEHHPREEHAPAATPAPQQATGVQTVTVSADENGMRVDRYLEAKFPGLSFSHIQRVIRKGELRIDGKRADSKDRLEAGQKVRIPPMRVNAPKVRGSADDAKTRDFLKSIMLFEDDDVIVLNKPMGLAVQGGSGMVRHVDGMLEALQEHDDDQRPRLVHRLDRDTAGCLLVAKTRFAAAALAKTFRTRSARKLYWALVAGVPKPKQGRISTFLAKDEREEESLMRIAKHGEEGASHAVTYYAVVETAAQSLSWISLKPVTGRTHQLRAHMEHIGHPIVGDVKYFRKENWHMPGGMQDKLHLLARRIVVPHPRGGTIDVTAPLPPHMAQSWNLLGFDASRYDPIVESPEE